MATWLKLGSHVPRGHIQGSVSLELLLPQKMSLVVWDRVISGVPHSRGVCVL